MIKQIGLVSPVIIPLILGGLLMFSSEKTNRPKLFLVVYMLIISFVFAANYYYFTYNYEVYSWLHSLHIATVLAIYPGAFIYLKLLTIPQISFKKLSVHFLPSIIFFFSSFIIFFSFLSMDERILFLSEYRFNPDFTKTWLKILYFVRIANVMVLFIQVFLYLFLIVRELRIHRKRVADIFSNPEKFQLNWLFFFNISLALSALICVFLYAANPAKLFGDDRYLAYPMLLIALILWFLGIMGNNQTVIPAGISPNENEDLSFDDGFNPELVTKLLMYFEDKKPYLNSELKIWDITVELGSNRTYISKAINNSFGQNFASFVNSYRIKEAKRMIEADPSKPLKIIAEDVGFGSISSLSRSFSQQYSINISEFRNQKLR